MSEDSNNTTDPKNRVVDFTEAREQKLEEKRRKNERIFFKQMLGIYGVTGSDEVRPIEIVDLSDDGLSFQVPFNPEDPWPKSTEELPIRLYFSQGHLSSTSSRDQKL